MYKKFRPTLLAGVLFVFLSPLAAHSESMEQQRITVSTTSLNINEGGSGTYTVVLNSMPNADVTVTMTVTGDSDVTVDTDSSTTGNQNTLVFTSSNYSTSQTVTVKAAKDADSLRDTATISHTSTSTHDIFNEIYIESVDVSVTDNYTNKAPTTRGSILDQTVQVGGSAATVEVSRNFSDPDGDTLTYTATSSDTTKATVSSSSSAETALTILTITPVAEGSATITVTATDSFSQTATQTFSVTVVQPNRSPAISSTIPDQQVRNSLVGEVYAHNYFSDPDGDTLTYTASTTDSSIASVNVGGVGNSTVYILANAVGTVTITAKATDPDGLSASQTFSATVFTNRAPTTVGNNSRPNAAPWWNWHCESRELLQRP